MFGHKRSTDSKQAVEKFLDAKKEPFRRLRYLLTAVDRLSRKANKVLFEQYYYVVYQVFHDAFTISENHIKSKGGWLRLQSDSSHQDFFEVVVPVLERILIYLPDLVYRRWQCTSIACVLAKFLHPDSAVKIRKVGMNLLVLWVQGLRENVTPFAEHLFASIVPGFAPASDRFDAMPWDACDSSWTSGPDVFTSSTDTQTPESVSDDTSVDILEDFMESLTSQCVATIQDADGVPHNGFGFLFHLFKKHYLFVLYREARLHLGPFDGGTSMSMCPVPTLLREASPAYARAFDSIAKWFMKWMLDIQPDASHHSRPDSAPAAADARHSVSAEMDMSTSADMRGHGPALRSEDYSQLVCAVLYESHENVVLIHEVLRCVFFLPAKYQATKELAVDMMHEWAVSPSYARPLFMHEPLMTSACGSPTSEDEMMGRPVTRPRSTSDALLTVKSAQLAHSQYVGVRAGFVNNMIVCIEETRQVLMAGPGGESLEGQVKACDKVIDFYRFLALHVPMVSEIWLHLHTALLTATEHFLRNMGHSPVRAQVAPSLLNTLFLVMINSSLMVPTPVSMWNNTLDLLGRQSSCPDVISQWTIAMDHLTNILSQQVFNMQLSSDEAAAGGPSSDQRGKARVRQQKRHQDGSGDERQSIGSSHTIPVHRKGGAEQHGGADVHARSTGSPQMPTRLMSSREALSRGAPSPGSDGDGVFGSSPPAQPIAMPHRVSVQSAAIGIRESAREPLSAAASSPDQAATALTPQSPVLRQSPIPMAPVLPKALLQQLNAIRRDSLTLNVVEPSKRTMRKTPRINAAPSPAQLCMDELAEASPPRHHHRPQGFQHFQDRRRGPAASLQRNFSLQTVGHMSMTALLMAGSESTSSPPLSRLPLTGAGRSTPSTPEKRFLSRRGIPEAFSAVGSSTSLTGITNRGSFSKFTPVNFDGSYKEGMKRSLVHLVSVESDLDDADLLDEDCLEVVLGGVRQGWTPASAAVVWRRMLGLLGNPNTIGDPFLHDAALRCVGMIIEALMKVYNRQGEIIDADAESEFDPPMLILAPWCFQACSISNEKFLVGRLRAYELLCRMTIVRHDYPVPTEHLSHFYRILYNGFTSSDREVVDCVTLHSRRMFSYCLPGSSCLINVVMSVAESILKIEAPQRSELSARLADHDTTAQSHVLRPETAILSALGALLQVDYQFPNLPVNSLGTSAPEASHALIKNRAITILLKVARFQTGRLNLSARCMAISMVGMYVFSELVHRRRANSRCAEGLYTLICAIGNTDSEVVQTAIDMLNLLTEYKLGLPETMSKKIVESLCSCASFIITEDFSGQLVPVKARETVLVNMLQCMVRWTMCLPSANILSHNVQNCGINLLSRVFQILHNACGKLMPEDLLNARYSGFSSVDSPGSTPTSESGPPIFSLAVNLAARSALDHLITFLDHYPFCAGAARPCSTVIECDDHARYNQSVDLVPGVFSAPNVQFFAYNGTTIISVSEIDAADENVNLEEDLRVGGMMTRLIIRNLSGKWTWDARSLHGNAIDTYPGICDSLDPNCNLVRSEKLLSVNFSAEMLPASVSKSTLTASSSPLPSQDVLRKAGGVPSEEEFIALDGDHLDELLQYMSATSFECNPWTDFSLSKSVPRQPWFTAACEEQMVDTIAHQHSREQNYLLLPQGSTGAAPCTPAAVQPPASAYHYSRFLLNQLGFLGADKVKSLKLLDKNDKLRRELKNLDSRPFRETHKIGVVYVGPGQADKQTILSNTKGSAAFEAFVAAMSWEVDLATHPGFMGGLQRNATTGSTAPYFATSISEVLFHVSTRMPTLEETGIINKLRHIGNDEVQIIWSENNRDWRRDIIRTEFGDVMIVLYPMKNGLCRVQILIKPGEKLPHFGPLFDGAVVDMASLPSLVRATAINANRAQRSVMQFFQEHYEERATYIAKLSQNCAKDVTLEQFFAEVLQPSVSA